MTHDNRDTLTTAEKRLQDQTNLLQNRQLLFCLFILSLGQLISFIDQNGISTILPTIAADLNAGDTISWAGTASLLANTTFQMLYGRLSDIFGRKAVFISAVLLLATGDIACGFSTNASMFYVFRGIAGIGSGGISSLTNIILSDVVTLESRGKYQGILGGMIGLGSMIGPFLAAAFVLKAGTWRGLFWLLAPLGVLNALLAFLYVPTKPPKTTLKDGIKEIDFVGALTLSMASILLLIPISGGGAYFPWSSSLVISMFAIGGLSLVIFIFSQWKFSKLPMMPIGIYRTPAVAILLAQCFLLGAVYQAMVYYIPLYLQNAHQFSILVSAAIFAPLAGVQAIVSAVSGVFISHYKRYNFVIRSGFAIWTLGAGLCLIFNRQTSPAVLVICLVIIGVGVGCTFQPALVALQANSPKERRAVIISARNFNRSLGGACGLAISAAALQAQLRSNLPADLQHLAKSSYTFPDIEDGGAASRVRDAYMASSHIVFVIQVPLIAACFLGALFLRGKRLAQDNGAQKAEKTLLAEKEPDATAQGSSDSRHENGNTHCS